MPCSYVAVFTFEFVSLFIFVFENLHKNNIFFCFATTYSAVSANPLPSLSREGTHCWAAAIPPLLLLLHHAYFPSPSRQAYGIYPPPPPLAIPYYLMPEEEEERGKAHHMRVSDSAGTYKPTRLKCISLVFMFPSGNFPNS